MFKIHFFNKEIVHYKFDEKIKCFSIFHYFLNHNGIESNKLNEYEMVLQNFKYILNEIIGDKKDRILISYCLSGNFL